MSFKWNVGIGPQHEGMNDHSLEFSQNRLTSVVRECIQNSIDAKDTSKPDEPVIITFEEQIVNIEDIIPDYEEWIVHAKRAINEANENNEGIQSIAKNAKKFLKNCENNKIRVLKISDSNTVGLEGVKEQKKRFDYLLTRKGSSVNQGLRGGSFGLGKFAPFTLSPIGTVIYSTRNIAGEFGYAAKTILQSYTLDEPKVINNSLNRYTLGTWWFYDNEDSLAINDKGFIDKQGFLKEDVGTDIYIVGMEDESGLDQEKTFIENISKEITENYFIAIKSGLLECNVIDSNGLSLTVNENFLETELKSSYELFSSLRREGDYPTSLSNIKYKGAIAYQAFAEDKISFKVEHAGNVDVWLKYNPRCVITDKVLKSNHIVFSRKNGQTVEYRSLGRKVSIEPFVAIICITDELGNEIFKRCEPPRHDKWDSSLIQNAPTMKKMADSALREIFSKLQTIIQERDDSNFKSREVKNARFIKFGQIDDPKDSLRLETEDEVDEKFTNVPPKVKLTIGDPYNDDDSDEGTKGGSGGRGRGRGSGGSGGSGSEKGDHPTSYIKRKRAIYQSDKQYNIVLFSDKDISNIELKLHARSDDKAKEMLIGINSASTNNNPLSTHDDAIIIPELQKGKNVLNVEIDRSNKFAIDVELISKGSEVENEL